MFLKPYQCFIARALHHCMLSLLSANEVAERLCFQSCLSVILFTGEVPMSSLPMMHWTSLYRLPWTSDIAPPLGPDPGTLLVTSGGHHWRPVHLRNPTPHPPHLWSNIWWSPLNHVQFASGRHASFWHLSCSF